MSKPNFSFEKKAWRKGYQLVIGVDEVGRGAFAGPVVAAAAAIKISNIKYKISKIQRKDKKDKLFLLNSIVKLSINDSKKLSPAKREIVAKRIKKYFYWGIGEVGVGVINRRGIVKATEMAMRCAIAKIKYQRSKIKNTNEKLKMPKQKTFVLADAFHIKYIPGIGLKHQQAIIKGDQKSISIAAASILAKVYRDNLMQKFAVKYSKYLWDRNKGYGTSDHQKAIKQYGICRLHRQKYIASWLG